MKYIVASVGKYQKPSRVFSHHTSTRGSHLKAKEIAKKYPHLDIGVFKFTENKWYGLVGIY